VLRRQKKKRRQGEGEKEDRMRTEGSKEERKTGDFFAVQDMLGLGGSPSQQTHGGGGGGKREGKKNIKGDKGPKEECSSNL